MLQTPGRLPFNRNFFLLIGNIFTFVAALFPPMHSQAQIFIDDSFEHFIAGKLDASGQNIYVSRDGKIRTIHYFDYDRDGYIDLLLPQTHDTYSDIPPALFSLDRQREVTQQGLAVRGALQAVTSDLNKDGITDIIFCPNYNGTQHPRDFLSICYGGKDGWPAARTRALLPVYGAVSVAIADMNHDGWPDVVALNKKGWKNNQPTGDIVRIFWGSIKGFMAKRSGDFELNGATSLLAADFNGDGFEDLCALGSDGNVFVFSDSLKGGSPELSISASKILQGKRVIALSAGDVDNNQIKDLILSTSAGEMLMYTGQTSGWADQPLVIKGIRSSQVSVSDLDSDGFNDLLISYLATGNAMGGELTGATSGSGQSLTILWGSGQGFSNANNAELPAPRLSAAAAGDFDGDGIKDIAIAINKGPDSFTTSSIIYFGKGNRQFEKSNARLETAGGSDVAILRMPGGQRDKVLISNSGGGTVDERVPAYLYWGSSKGFNERPRVEIPFRSGYESSAADFNADGFTDIAIMDEMHGGQGIEEDSLAGANIFWGSISGYDFSEKGRTVLSESYLGSSNVADLNKDGYLDLVLGQFTVEGYASSIIIYYGTKEGYSKNNRVIIPCTGRSLGVQLADYNKDGWLDIAANALSEDLVRIFLGGEKGFDTNRKIELEVPAVSDLETADLNRDGWLDIIATSYDDMQDPNHNDMGTTIFWGSANGFRHSHAQWLPGYTPLGPVVADFDKDGWLDIFGPSYHAAGTRETIPSYLYWGSAEGFNARYRTSLINDSGADGLAADFDKDGKLDLFIANHATNGGHAALSKILYNDGDRFRHPRVETVETRGPHWSHNEDMGHIYDRSWTQVFESRVFTYKKSQVNGRISPVAEMPGGTSLEFDIRSSKTPADLASATWQGVDASGTFSLKPDDRYLQYRAKLVSDNGDRFPTIDRVELNIGNDRNRK